MPYLLLAQLHLVALQDIHVVCELWEIVALTVLLGLYRFGGREHRHLEVAVELAHERDVKESGPSQIRNIILRYRYTHTLASRAAKPPSS
jgi:hypothetical protein